MRTSIWPAIHPRILELIREHRSTIVFTNSRRLAERLAQRLNELAGEDLVRAHHGSASPASSASRSRRSSRPAASPPWSRRVSLELGIDMGAVDLVIQVESPTSVARGLQRIGRAGHQVGEPSKGVIFPKYRGDLLETAVVVRGMRDGAIEQTVLPAQPARRPRPADRRDDHRGAVHGRRAARARPAGGAVRDARPARSSRASSACSRAPIRRDEFAELKPRIAWDRLTDVVEGRRDARIVAVTQRRHDPGPRPLPGVPRGRGRDAGPARRRARRGDGLRAAGRDARRRRRPRGELLAGRRTSAPTGSP